jgi:bifunctional non-homologous end joining protein LigD
MRIPGITKLPIALHPKHPPLLAVDAHEALVGLAQMNVVELHTWNAVQPNLEHPDRFVLDLDPDPSLSWQMMTEAAELAKVLLDEVGLKSFIKTSGGKGYHIVIPLTRRQGWDEVKAFSQGIARHMARVMPDRFSAVLGPKNRGGKIFIDYLRNSKGAQAPSPPSRHERGPAWACPCRLHGKSYERLERPTNGRFTPRCSASDHWAWILGRGTGDVDRG